MVEIHQSLLLISDETWTQNVMQNHIFSHDTAKNFVIKKNSWNFN